MAALKRGGRLGGEQLVDGASFDSMDQQFYAKPEDLPSLVMAYLARQEAH